MLSEGAPNKKDLCPYHRDASALKVIQPRRLDSILMPDVAEIPLIDGFRHVANIFWHKYGDIARSISDPEKQRKKDDRYTKHRVDMINFTRERLRNQTPCPLDYIYQETKRRTLEEVGLWPMDDAMMRYIFATEFLSSLRRITDEVAIEYFKPKNIAEQYICINIMGPISMWRTTLSSLSAFYEQPDISPEIWANIWPQIVKIHAELGTHFATTYPGSVLKAMIDILTEEAYFTFFLGPDGVLKCTFSHESLHKLIQKIETQDWGTIMRDDKRPPEVIGCPAAHVAFQPGESWIKVGINKVGNAVREVLYSYKK